MTPPIEGYHFLTIYSDLVDEYDKYEDTGDGDFDTSKVEEILARSIVVKPLPKGPSGPVDCTQAIAKSVETTLRSLRLDHDEKVTEMLVTAFEIRMKSICNTLRILQKRGENKLQNGFKNPIQQALKVLGVDCPLKLQDDYEQNIVDPLLDMVTTWNKIIDDQKNRTSLKVVCDADNHTTDISGDDANTPAGVVEAVDQKIPAVEVHVKEEERNPSRAQPADIEESVVKKDVTQHIVEEFIKKNEDCLSVRNSIDACEGKIGEMENNDRDKDVPVADKEKPDGSKETEKEMDSMAKKVRSTTTQKVRKGKSSLVTTGVPVADEEEANKANNREDNVVAGKKPLTKNTRKPTSTKMEVSEQKSDDVTMHEFSLKETNVDFEQKNSSSETKVEAEPVRKRGRRPSNFMETSERNSRGMPAPLKRKSADRMQDVGVKQAAIEMSSPRPKRSCTETKYTTKREKNTRKRSAIQQEQTPEIHPVPATEHEAEKTVQASVILEKEAVVSPPPLLSSSDTTKQHPRGKKNKAIGVHPVAATEYEPEKTVPMSENPEKEAVVSTVPSISQLELVVRGTCPRCQHHIIFKQNLVSSFTQMEVAPQPSLEAHEGFPEENES